MLLSRTVVALALAAIRVVAQQGGGLTVDTAQGNVTGTLVSPTVRRFLGIPYAVANRWEAPQNPPVRTNTFNASNFGDSCPQSPPAGFSEILGPVGASSESEDCLNINIWAPSVQRTQNTAVMLWIHGGGFQFGTVCSHTVVEYIMILMHSCSERTVHI
jgi:carboxylesterase type B